MIWAQRTLGAGRGEGRPERGLLAAEGHCCQVVGARDHVYGGQSSTWRPGLSSPRRESMIASFIAQAQALHVFFIHAYRAVLAQEG